MNRSKAFFLAARPKTWSAAIAPVAMGTALAAKEHFSLSIFLLTLLFALLIQIGTNYANDYFDFMKGADTSQRVGPKRAVQQGWIAPKSMWRASRLTFELAFLLALPLMLQAGPWSFAIAALSILFGILYTGGPKPLGYLGLGELLVFLFFGPVALAGTYFLQTKALSTTCLIASIPPGLLSAAILIANNLRDAATDAKAGKKTLVVRFGVPCGKVLFYLFFVISLLFATILSPLLPLVFLFSIPIWPSLFRSEFTSLLPKTSLFLMLYTVAFVLWI